VGSKKQTQIKAATAKKKPKSKQQQQRLHKSEMEKPKICRRSLKAEAG
jgi:hypothetical protein